MARFGVQGIPALVVLGADGAVVTSAGVQALRDYIAANGYSADGSAPQAAAAAQGQGADGPGAGAGVMAGGDGAAAYAAAVAAREAAAVARGGPGGAAAAAAAAAAAQSVVFCPRSGGVTVAAGRNGVRASLDCSAAFSGSHSLLIQGVLQQRPAPEAAVAGKAKAAAPLVVPVLGPSAGVRIRPFCAVDVEYTVAVDDSENELFLQVGLTHDARALPLMP
jgi:hypothetical protein